MHASAKFALLLCCLPALMGAQVYRWVDDKGVVNYSQQKPDGIPSEHIEAASGMQIRETAVETNGGTQATTSPSATGQPPAERLTQAQRDALAALEAAERSRQAELANVRAANCERARGVLDRLTASGRIRVRDADGNETAMSEEEHQQRIAEAQRGVVEYCID